MSVVDIELLTRSYFDQSDDDDVDVEYDVTLAEKLNIAHYLKQEETK